MSINGIPAHLAGLSGIAGARETGRPEGGASTRTESRAPLPANANRPAAGAASADALGVSRPPASLPAEPPAGTDPELWSVLSAEERVFFARIGAMGPLTYGRLSGEPQLQPSVARGSRIDLKV